MTRLHPLEPMIADYLNGHLAAGDVETIERAIEDDPELRSLVDFENRIQRSVRSTTSDTVSAQQPRFSDIENRIDKKKWAHNQWGTWGLPIAAAVLVVTVFVAQSSLEDQIQFNEYETLSDVQPNQDYVSMRIIGHSDTSLTTLKSLLADFDLIAVSWDTTLNSVEVSTANLQDITAVQDRLVKDPRVLAVNLVGNDGADSE